jgi:succinate dehydrogenase flavin-adding protein (antitoxin of CptAB toxin-antitoxin module)
MLRQLWSLIETTQTNLLLKQDDASLVQWILKQFKQKRSLDTQEADIISDYIYSRISLIRDLAAQR